MASCLSPFSPTYFVRLVCISSWDERLHSLLCGLAISQPFGGHSFWTRTGNLWGRSSVFTYERTNTWMHVQTVAAATANSAYLHFCVGYHFRTAKQDGGQHVADPAYTVEACISSGLTWIVYAEVRGNIPHCAAVKPKIIRIPEGDRQQTVYHQLAGNRRPEK